MRVAAMCLRAVAVCVLLLPAAHALLLSTRAKSGADAAARHFRRYVDDWEDVRGEWRDRTPAPLETWLGNIPPPHNMTPMAEWSAMDDAQKQSAFASCLQRQADAFTGHVLARGAAAYRSPSADSVRGAVNTLLKQRGAKVVVAVFWGRCAVASAAVVVALPRPCVRNDLVHRLRYVSILWKYLERNLRCNGGVVDTVMLLMLNRDDASGMDGAQQIAKDASTKYPQREWRLSLAAAMLCLGLCLSYSSTRASACGRVAVHRRRGDEAVLQHAVRLRLRRVHDGPERGVHQDRRRHCVEYHVGCAGFAVVPVADDVLSVRDAGS
jgi:hypothetical protein